VMTDSERIDILLGELTRIEAGMLAAQNSLNRLRLRVDGIIANESNVDAIKRELRLALRGE